MLQVIKKALGKRPMHTLLLCYFIFAPPFPRTLVAMLQSRGTAVYLISGGFRQLIEPFAKYLGIPKDHIFANRILFNEEGMYINIK